MLSVWLAHPVSCGAHLSDVGDEEDEVRKVRVALSDSERNDKGADQEPQSLDETIR